MPTPPIPPPARGGTRRHRRSVLGGLGLAALGLVTAGSVLPVVSQPAAQHTDPQVLLVGTYHGIPGTYASIQAAVDAARPGDWILIGPGDHKETGARAPAGRPDLPAGVLITTPDLHLRGMDRDGVVVDGTKPGSLPCSDNPADQELGPSDPAGGGPGGRNGILVWQADDVSVENLTVCNYLHGSGTTGNEIWWDGGDGSGTIGGWGFTGSYLTATSTYYDGPATAAQYGIFSSNWSGGTWQDDYASNFDDSGFYIGACQDRCNQTVDGAWSEYNALGYSGSNSGGQLVVEHSQFDENEDGFDTNSQNGDNPPPQDGTCPDGGTSPITHTRSCWVFMDNWVHDNNNPDVPAAGSAAAGPVGTGLSVSGGRNDTVMDNVFENNGAWGTIFVPYPDSGPPCTGGTGGGADSVPCLYDENGDALIDNTYAHNGFFGNPTNGDFAAVNTEPGPTDCYRGNTDGGGPATSSPPTLELTYPQCTGQTVPPNANVLFADEVACDSESISIGPLTGGMLCPPGANYPRRTQVVMHPLPGATSLTDPSSSSLPSMADPCAGVPANPWCPADSGTGTAGTPSAPRRTAAPGGRTGAGKAGPATPASPRTAAAVQCPLTLTPSAHLDPPGGVPFTICSGRIPSFDGTPLDTDVSIPDGADGPLPLVVMLHGWGGSKTDFESSTLAGNGQNTDDWNNAWFTAHGDAVLTYTARGFGFSCGQDPSAGYSYATDPACAGRASWTHLADRRWEVRDAQYLTGLLVDAGVALPDKVVATGDSYGGGQSWLLALSQDQVLHRDGTLGPWNSPRGTPIELAAAVPQFPWTDLLQALVDNGRGSDGLFGAPPDGDHTDPVGVEKQSYVDALYADGQATAQYAPPGADPSADLPGWLAAVSAGEPYGADPLVAQAMAQLEHYRSPLAMPVPPPGRRVPVLDLQGVTDPLFPAVQALELVGALDATGPGAAPYPVWTILGDLGHAYASNPTALWQQVNADANAWLSSILAGEDPSLPRFSAITVACDPSSPSRTYQADTMSGLVTGSDPQHPAGHVVTLAAGGTATTSSASAPGPEAVASEPLAGSTAVDSVDGSSSSCVRMPVTTDPGVAAWTFPPLAEGGTSATIIGGPVLRASVTVTGPDAAWAARLWDVDPSTGTQTLITRAVYRDSATAASSSSSVAFELWPTAWVLPPGHELKLELTQDDTPTWRTDNLPSVVMWSGVTLSLPVRT